MSALARLREAHLSATERRIADYIIRNADALPEGSISQVAQACDTSKSMVVQTCKAAGFMGFKDLRSRLLVEKALDQQPAITYDDIRPGYTPQQIARSILSEEIQALQDTLSLLDTAALEDAVQLLAQADRILLFGVSGSAVPAQDMHNKLCRLGLNVRFTPDVHCQLLETAAMTENSVAVVFSYHGRTQDMLEACRLTHEMGAKVIALTRYGKTPVGEAADVRLCVAGSDSLQRVTAMSSRTGTMGMVDVLFGCLAAQMSERAARLAQRSVIIAARRRK